MQGCSHALAAAVHARPTSSSSSSSIDISPHATSHCPASETSFKRICLTRASCCGVASCGCPAGTTAFRSSTLCIGQPRGGRQGTMQGAQGSTGAVPLERVPGHRRRSMAGQLNLAWLCNPLCAHLPAVQTRAGLPAGRRAVAARLAWVWAGTPEPCTGPRTAGGREGIATSPTRRQSA